MTDNAKLQIIYQHGKPYGIRDRTGYLFFFTKISKYDGQEERYRRSIERQYALADYLLCALLNQLDADNALIEDTE